MTDRRLTSSHGWPWGENEPTRFHRVIVAACIATVAALLVYWRYHSAPPHQTDFGHLWFAARSLLHHIDPYPLIGPGLEFNWRFPILYPATAFVPLMPFAVFPEYLAQSLFVWISTFLLVYGMTAKGWHLLPILASYAFLLNVERGQWTILVTAMMFLPAVAMLALAKPQMALPVILTRGNSVAWQASALGGIVLLMVSVILLPSWPVEWLNIIRHNPGDLHSPIFGPLGFLILPVLFRWRRRDAWFVFLLACIPQTWDYYNTLPLLALAMTYREACTLSLVSTIGGFTAFVLGERLASTTDELIAYYRASIALFAYLPAVIMVLRRPNETGREMSLRLIPSVRNAASGAILNP